MPNAKYARPKSLSRAFHQTEFLRPGDLVILMPWSRTTIDKMIAAGELPGPDVVRNTVRFWRKSTMMPAIRRVLGIEVGGNV